MKGHITPEMTWTPATYTVLSRSDKVYHSTPEYEYTHTEFMRLIVCSTVLYPVQAHTEQSKRDFTDWTLGDHISEPVNWDTDITQNSVLF